MTNQNTKNEAYETIKTITIALLLAGIIRSLFFQPFYIPTSSMKPNLLINDFLFVNKMAYGYSKHSCPLSMCVFIEGRWFKREPKRGDIVVFREKRSNNDFIKRLIGLPGDKIQLKDGIIHINGQALVQVDNGLFIETNEIQGRISPSRPRCSNAPVRDGANCEKIQLIETNPEGKSYNILEVGPHAGIDNTRVFTVPIGKYFFMGDNRDNSGDSRIASIGFIDEVSLIGRADRVILSSAGKRVLYFWKWRPDRFFKALN